MRLMVELLPCVNGSFENVNKHAVQGMIYAQLKKTVFENYHDSNRFKFFTFSDLFPVSDFKVGEKKKLIISSPNNELITVLYETFEKHDKIHIKNMEFNIHAVNKFRLKPSTRYITGSPIVLYKDNRSNEYFSFERNKDLIFFLERLKENALKKYFAYTGRRFDMKENLFDRLIFKKEVVVKDYKAGREFIIIGSVWKLLEKFYISAEQKRFYEFIMDCGLGEKNSLGFGFVNPIRE